MKTNRIFLFLLFALPTLMLQSCLTDDDEKFDQSSSARMEEFLQSAQQTLMAAPNGWALDYYPEANQKYGGFTYTIKFDGERATVGFENNLQRTETSLYKLKTDDGPVLSFDTYNPFIHNFSTPAQGLYQGYEGDFEFVIDSVGTDLIKLHGKRSLNTMYLRRLADGETDAAYIRNVVDMGNTFSLISANLNVGGKDARLDFDVVNRQVDIVTATDSVRTAYAYTDKGLRIYLPKLVNGSSVWDLAYDDDKLTLSADGVETKKCFVDPSLVTGVIGSIGSDDGSFSRVVKDLPHLDQFTFETDADWLTIKTQGDRLTLAADANTTGHVRSAHVYVVNGQYVQSFTVSQVELKDILGGYTFYYTDADGGEQMADATLSQTAEGVALQFTARGNISLVFPGQFDQKQGAVVFQSGQLLGNLASRGYYFFDTFDVGVGSTGVSNVFSLPVNFEYNERYGTLGAMSGPVYAEGQPTGYTCEKIIINVTKTPQPTSNSDILGYWDHLGNGLLQKKQAAGAKASLLDRAAYDRVAKAAR